MNIGSLLANTARSQGNETAVFRGLRPVWTYREMARRASTLANGFDSDQSATILCDSNPRTVDLAKSS